LGVKRPARRYVKLEAMHTRRMAGFLLGVWLGGSLLMILIQVENLRFTASLWTTPSDQAAELLKKTTPRENVELLMRYQAAEQNRRYTYTWEEAQFGLALILGGCLFMGTQRRIFPMLFCGLMLLMVIFQHLGVTPELAYRGRDVDFPPGNASYSGQTRVWALYQVYGWVEGTKLVLGTLLAGYLFIFRAGRTRRQIKAIDYPQHSHIDG
jgi:hypothetical protein